MISEHPSNSAEGPLSGETPARPRRLQSGAETETERDLQDFWIALVRRRKIAITVFTIFVAVGAIISITRQNRYTFTTTIRIGATPLREDGQEPGSAPLAKLVEPADEALAKLKDIYIPTAQDDLARESPGTRGGLPIKARASGERLILEAKGRAAEASACLKLRERATQKLAADHGELARARLAEFREQMRLRKEKLSAPAQDPLEREVANSLAESEEYLARIRDEHETAILETKLTEEREKILREELEDAKRALKLADENRAQATKTPQADVHPLPLTLLAIDKFAGEASQRLRSIEYRLNVEVPRGKRLLKEEIADLERRRETLSRLIEQFKSDLAIVQKKLEGDRTAEEELIKEMEASLENVTGTSVLIPPKQMLRASDSNRLFTFVAFLLLGLMFGILAALFVEFASAAQKRIAAGRSAE